MEEKKKGGGMMFFRVLKKALGLALVLAGTGALAAPAVSTAYVERQTAVYEKEFNSFKNGKKKEKDSRYREAAAYNKQIFEDRQTGFASTSSYEDAPIDMSGFPEGKFGIIKIPKLELKLPLYIGSSKGKLAKGLAVLGQTSIPIGGENTNSVIAGHRGYMGIPYLREIEKLEKGDKVVISNPWEKLVYEVAATAVVSPYDRDSVLIKEGEDMVTLMTCHPYRTHGRYRYLVYCTRKGKNGKADPQAWEKMERFVPSEGDIRREDALLHGCITVLMLMAGWKLLIKRKERSYV